MPSLRHPKLELFARELAEGLNAGLSERVAARQASEVAGYPKGTSFATNAHKRAQRRDVKLRVTELRAPGIKRAEEQAAITTEYLLAKLQSLVEFNPDDYLSEPDEDGERHFTLKGASRDLLGRVAALKIGRVTTGRGKRRRVFTFVNDVAGHDPLKAVQLIAQIKGLMAPEKLDHTVRAANQMTDDELAHIARGGGRGTPPPAPSDP